MKTLAKSLAILLLVIFTTGSPVIAINLATGEFTINLELKLFWLVNQILSVIKAAKQNWQQNSNAIDSLWNILAWSS